MSPNCVLFSMVVAFKVTPEATHSSRFMDLLILTCGISYLRISVILHILLPPPARIISSIGNFESFKVFFIRVTIFENNGAHSSSNLLRVNLSEKSVSFVNYSTSMTVSKLEDKIRFDF